MRFEDLTKVYVTGSEKVTALDNVCFDFPTNGLVTITGKSGCGKTTLLYVAAGLLEANDGAAWDGEINLCKLSEKELDDYRNANMGIVFQDYKLLEDRSVYANLELALDIRKVENHSNKISETLSYVGLSGYEKRKVSELSGGQKQRVAIARALVKDCKMILADEPTGNLDESNSLEIWKLLKEISKTKLILAVTHDKETARRISDVIIEMSDGKISGVVSKGVAHNERLCIYYGDEEKVFSSDESKELYLYLRDICGKIAATRAMVEVEFREEKLSPEADSNNNVEDCNYQNLIKNLSFRSATAFAAESIKKRLVRHFLTSLMFSFVLLITFVLIMLFNWDCYDAIERYLIKDNTPYAFFRLNAEYTDAFGTENGVLASRGIALTNALNLCFNSESIFASDNAHIMDFNEEIKVFYADYIPGAEIKGKWPETGVEIAISDYLADVLQLNIDSEIVVDNATYVVCGVFDTIYKDEDLQKEIRFNRMEEGLFYKYQTECLVTVVSKENSTKKFDGLEVLSLTGSNFFYTVKLSDYAWGEMQYGLADNCSENLIAGRMPQNRNEIIVSKKCYQVKTGKEVDEWEQETFLFRDLYDAKYNDFFSESLNLFDVFPDGITIVGIYEDAELLPVIGIQKEAWEEIVQLQMEYFSCTEFGVFLNEQQKTVGSFMKDNKVLLEIPAALEMVRIHDSVAFLRIFILAALMICSLIFLIMVINCISLSVRDSARTIGIMRAVGVRKQGTFSVFFTEMGYVMAVGLILASIWIVTSVSLINDFFKSYHKGETFNLFVISPLEMLIMYVIVFVVGYLVVLIPINELGRKKPVDLLRMETDN